LPRVSIAIPTWNRSQILARTLAQLPEGDIEIIVSDNASTDDTPVIVKKAMKADKRIRYVCMEKHGDTFANTRKSFEAATTPFVVYMPDDDAIMAEPLMEHVSRLEAEPELAAIFTDSIAWDDAEEKEMHRYYPQGFEPIEFGPEHNLEIADFLLKTFIPPEIGVFRRDAALKARVPVSKAQPYHQWCYALTRLGRVRFDSLAFLKEIRVLKPHLKREYWGNMDGAWAYIGDEQRLGLEAMYLRGLRDANRSFVPDWLRLQVYDRINHMLLNRTSLEIQRACQRGDYILAVELRRRQVLYWGDIDQISDYHGLTLPAARQASEMTGAPLDEMIAAYQIGYGYEPPARVAEEAA
jgi:glycosyltransferase involved in cell wall biosynthesis